MTTPPTLLVVDDEPLLRTIMSEWLELEGYRVLTADHGVAALRVLESNHVDAIVTDIRMPEMDGVTLLKRINDSGRYVPPAIVLSGFTDTTPREAYDLGVEMFLSKPFTFEQLLSAVKRIFTPRAERWRLPEPATASQALEATFPTLAAAQQLGKLAFGRGGFCVRSAAKLREAPVRFTLNFSEEDIRIAGHGFVRWIQSGEGQIGVEITRLEGASLTRAGCLPAGSGARCYIPRTSTLIRQSCERD